MLNDFNSFGLEHIVSIFIPIFICILFILLVKKYPNKKKTLNIILAIILILIRSTRYIFDINLGLFQISDLFQLHICNIDLYLLLFCLFKPTRQIFIFTYLVGIPTALSVALFPGKIHPEPGMLRAIFFIMSHMMLAVIPIYLLYSYKYIIKFKNLLTYYMISFFGIILMYFCNINLNTNYMYLIEAPKKTVLELMYNNFGPLLYIVSIYIILIILITILYFVYKLFSIKTNE